MAKAELRITLTAPQLDTAITLLRKIEERTRHMANQDDITRLTAAVTASTEKVTTATTAIRQDIADLKDANPGLDVTALEASVSELGTAVGGLETLDAENPVPPSA